MSRRPQQATLRRPWQLTAAEWRVMRLIVQGASNKEIAHALVISVRTVQTYANIIYRKVGVRSRLELVVKVNRELSGNSGVTPNLEEEGMLKLTLHTTAAAKNKVVLVHPDTIESVRPVDARYQPYTAIRTRSGDVIHVCESVATIEQQLQNYSRSQKDGTP